MATKQQITNDINLFDAIQQFCADKGLSREAVLDVIKDSLVTAYKRRLNIDPECEDISVEFNEKNEVVIVVSKEVVDLETELGPLQISLADAQEIEPEVALGDSVAVREKPVQLSRIVSNQARQMVFQRLKEMERELLYDEYKAKEGELTHGFFQRWRNRDTMSIDLGKVEAIMPRKEQSPGERYKQGDRLKAIIAKVELKRERSREPGPIITLSRASADFVKKLFEMEIPEIYDGLIEIVDIARMPSYRTKIVVRANRSDIDPIGACVGMKGVRIQSIVRELGNERVDIIQYTENVADFITNAISPARPVDIRVDYEKREAIVVVGDDSNIRQAIGPKHANVRLASQISGYRIEIYSQSQYYEEMSSPAARQSLERLFQPQTEEVVDERQETIIAEEEALYEEEYTGATDEEVEDDEEAGTPLDEIPGLTPRVIGLLESGGILDVESLIEMHPDELAKVTGIGPTTSEHIMKLLAESVELVDEESSEE
ncbi:MAG: transcription termination factor NusA [Spirochaetota bacterium]